MDAKLADFYNAARRSGLLDDTLLIVTSDHGEAFGEHGLYLHDASVYDTHLHVPLWIHHPELPATVVDDLVSTRDLFGLMRAVGLREGLGRTILDRGYRAEHPIALAEHFHYPHAEAMLPRYQQNLVAVIAGARKAILRRSGLEQYDLVADPDERAPIGGTIADLEAACRGDGLPGAAIAAATAHLQRWQSVVPAVRHGAGSVQGSELGYAGSFSSPSAVEADSDPTRPPDPPAEGFGAQAEASAARVGSRQ